MSAVGGPRESLIVPESPENWPNEPKDTLLYGRDKRIYFSSIDESNHNEKASIPTLKAKGNWIWNMIFCHPLLTYLSGLFGAVAIGKNGTPQVYVWKSDIAKWLNEHGEVEAKKSESAEKLVERIEELRKKLRGQELETPKSSNQNLIT